MHRRIAAAMIAFCLAVPAATQAPSDATDVTVDVIGESPGIRPVQRSARRPTA